MQKPLRMLKLLLMLLLTVIVSCKTLDVKDAEFCGNLGEDGAHCNHTLVQAPRDLTADEWKIQSIGWLCMDSQDFTNTETALDQACQLLQCTYEEKQTLDAMKIRIRETLVRGDE